MTKQINLLFILITTLFFSACIEEIDFEVPREYRNSTVIVGKLVNSEKPSVEVFIQKIFDFSFVEEKYLQAKNLYLVDEEGSKIEIPKLGLGRYRLDLSLHPDFIVKVGKSYHIELELFDGQKFSSNLETIESVPKITDLTAELISKETINFRDETVIRQRVNYCLSTPLVTKQNANPVNLKWEVIRTHKQTDNKGKVCYISSSPDFDHIEYWDPKALKLQNLKSYPILQQNITGHINEGQYISVIQESISDEGLEFFKQMKELSINSGTFYEPPPGQIISNFRKTDDSDGSVFGFFYATTHDTMHVYVGPELVGYTSNICPYLERDPSCTDDCCDCENAENSTTIKPSFWTN